MKTLLVTTLCLSMMVAAAVTAGAEGAYTKLATFTCFYGTCQPGLPISQIVEVSPGSFFGSLTFGMLYTLSSAGDYQTRYALPGANLADASSPFHASDGYLYVPAQSNGSALVYRYDLQQPPQPFPVPVFLSTSQLVEGPDLNLYGAQVPVLGSGVVYSLNFSGQSQVVATLPQQLSVQTLVDAADGNLYALTAPFVQRDYSALLRFDADRRHGYRILSIFPRAQSMIQASDGNFYGCGGKSLFRLTTSGNYREIYTFPGGSTGSAPYGCGIQASDGNLYGTTLDGGSGHGTIFRSTLDGEVSTVYAFTGADQGQHPSQYVAGLVQGSDGRLYGQTTSSFIGSPGTNIGATTYSLDLGLPKPAPAITRATPDHGAAGTSVLISGRNFLGATAVNVNGVSASFQVKAGGYLQMTIPAGASTGAVSVTTPNGSATSSFAIVVE